MNRTMSIGDIINSRIYISIEKRHSPILSPFFHIGPTYSGTLTGLHIGLHRYVFMAHIREG